MSLEWIGAKKRWREQPRRRGQAHELRLADRCFGRGVSWRNIIGKMCKIKWVGKALPCRGKRTRCVWWQNGWRICSGSRINAK